MTQPPITNSRGFTLVELLITVAIIGILMVGGRPYYSRMIKKAKRGEAYTLLGGLKVAESGFHGEFGVYGNQIEKVGFALSAPPEHYTIGFAINPGCKTQTNILPLIGSPQGIALQSKAPSYYSTPNVTRIKSKDNPPGCGTGTVDIGQFDPTPTYQFYAGSASAILSPKNDPPSANTADGDYDIWMLGSGKDIPPLDGVLFNVVDGID